MTERPDPQWRNHPHWDHAAAEPAPGATDRFLAGLEPRLRHAHLPQHPGTSLGLIAAGAGHFVLVRHALGDLVPMALGGDHAYGVVAWTLLVILVLPGLALLLTGAWDLVGGPIRYFVPRWFHRRPARR